ncbi:MAG: CADD family putative folate metabolism protein, partial [Myxococcaceae bacterium]
MKLSARLDEIIAKRHLLTHPFYRAWTAGELSKEVIRDYAVEYYPQVAAFPRFVSAVHSRCPDIAARKVLLENLVDEELKGADHPELWMRFAEGMGARRDEVAMAKTAPESTQAVDTFMALTSGDWTRGLCALYAYESQVPSVSQSKIDGLVKFYGVSDPRTLQFFKAHITYDVEHSRAIAALIDQH